MLRVLFHAFVFIALTIITQIGGIIYALALFISPKFKPFPSKILLVFCTLYCLFTFVLVPFIAPFFGREKVMNTPCIKPTSWITVLFNRNYVKPQLNKVLQNISSKMEANNSSVKIHYLDASFPFINNFPLLPHVSHKDGKKLDVSLIYEDTDGKISDLKKSVSGYGIFVAPEDKEFNQTEFCFKNGYYQYDFPKYLTLGSINKELIFSSTGTKELMTYLLQQKEITKIFLEKHLKNRLQLTDSRIRFQGCSSVRHDDHIHIQL